MKNFLLLIIMISAALPAWAEDKTISLDEVVVTATRTEEDIDKISSNVTVITQEDIKKSTATTVQDLLRNEAGIIIRDLYGTGTKSTVDMRGFARGLNTAILMDGRKLNEIDLSGVDWNTIPLENIERIEIVRGSGSVLYGDNAMAGAINIITKKGHFTQPELMLDARAESYSGHTELGTFTGGTDKIGYFFLLKHRQTSGYRENSDFTAADMNTRLDFKITDFFSFDFAAGYHTDDQGLPGGHHQVPAGCAHFRFIDFEHDDFSELLEHGGDGPFQCGGQLHSGDVRAEQSFANRHQDRDLLPVGQVIEAVHA